MPRSALDFLAILWYIDNILRGYFSLLARIPVVPRLTNQTRQYNRLCGVFVTVVRHGHKGSRVRVGQFFPSTLAASRHLGYHYDVLGKALRRSLDDGRARVGKVHFVTAKQIYIDWGKCGWTDSVRLLRKYFPFIYERKVEFGRRLRTPSPPPAEPPPVSLPPEYEI